MGAGKGQGMLREAGGKRGAAAREMACAGWVWEMGFDLR